MPLAGTPEPVAQVDDSSVYVEANDGTGHFGPPVLWANYRFYGTRGTYLARVTPGPESVVAINDSSVWVEPNQGGRSFAAPQV